MLHHRIRTLLSAGVAIVTAGSGLGVAQTQAHASDAQAFVSRVNARWTSVTDESGIHWAARNGFLGPAERSDLLADCDIIKTTNDTPYRSNINGATGFSIAVPNGSYQVRLLMAEDYHSSPGKRVFDVHAEGVHKIKDLDIVAAVGKGAAYDRTFTTTVLDSRLDVDFRATQDKSLISAIEVVRSVDAAVPRPAPTSPSARTGTALLDIAEDVERGGLPIERTGDVVTTSVGPAEGRSETFYDVGNQRIRLPRRATVTTEFDVLHELNNPATGASPDPATWHVLFQLLGPTQAGSWPGPPFSVAVAGGTYRFGGGAAVPDDTGTLRFRGSWVTPYPTAADHRWHHFKIETFLDGPGSGWVSLWLDGRQYLDKWKPTAGTFYTDSGRFSHKDIQIKTGLYTGTGAPAWTRKAQHRGVKIAWTLPDGVSTIAQLLG